MTDNELSAFLDKLADSVVEDAKAHPEQYTTFENELMQVVLKKPQT